MECNTEKETKVNDKSSILIPFKRSYFEVSKTFTFDAAHRLHLMNKDHPCSNIHGHTYSSTLTLKLPEDSINNVGMVLDYRDFSFYKDFLDSLDHTVLVAEEDKKLTAALKLLDSKYTLLPIKQTTCECLLSYLLSIVKDMPAIKHIKDVQVCLSLSETPKTNAKIYFQYEHPIIG